jgi:hypothetical protein
MRIVWHQNPLYTQVFLTHDEMRFLRERAVNEELYGEIFALSSGRSTDEGLDKRIDYIESRANGWLISCVDALENDAHCGSCVKICGACTKCFAEEQFNLDTLGSFRHPYYVYLGFGFDKNKTIDEAIESLHERTDTTQSGEFVEQWKIHRLETIEDLLAYKEKHFNEQS